MVDMMMNLLIFLLTLYGTDPIDTRPTPELLVPDSTSQRLVQYAVEVRVSSKEIAVNGKRVLTLHDGAAGPAIPEGVLVAGQIPALGAELASIASTLPPQDPAQPAPREIDVQCDKRTSWDVLGPVVETAGKAGFVQLRFIVRTASAD